MSKVSNPASKAERHEWAKLGDRGRRAMVPIEELNIDHSYQRSEGGHLATLNTARAFDYVACGTLVVMERPNGKKYVVDGQQRLAAARLRGDIKELPCIVFKSDGATHEALAFSRLNVNRRPVTSVEKFRASVAAGIMPEREIQEWLKEMGMVVSSAKNKRNSSVIDFPAILVRLWGGPGKHDGGGTRYYGGDTDISKEAILLQRRIIGDEIMNGSIHQGLWYIMKKGIDAREHVDKLQRVGGKSAILRELRANKIETGRPVTQLACAQAILNLINKGRRRKITLFGHGER